MRRRSRPARAVEHLLGRIPLIGKIFMIFVFGVLFPMLLQITTFYQETLENTQALVQQQMTNAAERVQRLLSSSFYDARQLMLRYYSDTRLYAYFDEQYATNLDYLIAYQEVILPIVTYEIPFHPQLKALSFYTTNKTVYNGAWVRKYKDPADVLSDFANDDYCLEAVFDAPYSSMHMGIMEPQKSNQRCLVLTCPMTYHSQNRTVSTIVRLDLNMDYYHAALRDIGLFDNMLLADAQGRVISCANTYRTTGAYDLFDQAALPKDMVLLSYPLEHAPFTLYAYYDSGILHDQFWRTMLHAVGYSLIGLAIAGAILMIIARSLTRHTRDILSKTEYLSQGRFDDPTFSAAPAGHDELAQIERRINELSVQLREYIDREYAVRIAHADLEKQVTQARLQALQSQVNPHFLFNALESIRLNALERDKQETMRMIKYMARMFRYLVEWQGDIVPLRQELKFLDEYLIIQKYRFGSEFQYTIEVDEETEECLLPKLILQPMVENACVHGVEATSSQKNVSIEVRIRENRLVMQVKDNGRGMAPERLQEVLSRLRSGQCSESVGLSNVYQRLLLYYHDQFSFNIVSDPGRSTVCTVEIPVQYERPSGREV